MQFLSCAVRFSQRGNALHPEKNASCCQKLRSHRDFCVRLGLMSSCSQSESPPAIPPNTKSIAHFYRLPRRVPKTYLTINDRELVSDPTNRSARNGHNTKSLTCNGNNYVTAHVAGTVRSHLHTEYLKIDFFFLGPPTISYFKYG